MTRTNVAAAVLAMFASVVLLARPATAGTNRANPTVKLKLGTKLAPPPRVWVVGQRSGRCDRSGDRRDNGDETAFGYSGSPAPSPTSRRRGGTTPGPDLPGQGARATTSVRRLRINYALGTSSATEPSTPTPRRHDVALSVGEVELEATRPERSPTTTSSRSCAPSTRPPRSRSRSVSDWPTRRPVRRQPGCGAQTSTGHRHAPSGRRPSTPGFWWSEAQAKRWIWWLQARRRRPTGRPPTATGRTGPVRRHRTTRRQRHRHRGPDEQQPHAGRPGLAYMMAARRFPRSGLRLLPARCLGYAWTPHRGSRSTTLLVRTPSLLDLRLAPSTPLGGAHRRVVLSASGYSPPPGEIIAGRRPSRPRITAGGRAGGRPGTARRPW